MCQSYLPPSTQRPIDLDKARCDRDAGLSLGILMHYQVSLHLGQAGIVDRAHFILADDDLIGFLGGDTPSANFLSCSWDCRKAARPSSASWLAVSTAVR